MVLTRSGSRPQVGQEDGEAMTTRRGRATVGKFLGAGRQKKKATREKDAEEVGERKVAGEDVGKDEIPWEEVVEEEIPCEEVEEEEIPGEEEVESPKDVLASRN